MSVAHEIIAPKENADDILLVSKLYYKNKDLVSKGDELIDLETSKTAVILESAFDGFVEYLVVQGDSINAGEVVIRIHNAMDSINVAPNKSQENCVLNESKVLSRKAQDFVNENNVDISNVNKKFITFLDLVPSNEGVFNKKSNVNYVTLSSLDANLKTIQRGVSLAKKTEIAALSNVQTSGLVSTIFYNLDDCKLPESNNLIMNTAGSFLPIIAFEVSKLLKQFPMLNAYYFDNSVMEYIDVNIGIALDIDNGLKVYTIKNSNLLTYEELEYKISEGVYDYFRKTLISEKIKGSTFTITDLSSLGVDRFIPLINYQQSAILGISGLDEKLNRITLSLSFDHRVTEGKVASNFLKMLVHGIQKRNQT